MGLILTPNEISDLSRSVRPAAEEGTPAWGTTADVLGRGFRRFVVEPDTVALWDFTRKLGDPLADLSPEGNDLTLHGDVVRVADGPFGFSYDFPGSDDYLMTSGNPVSLQITGELTVEVIAKVDILAGYFATKDDYGDNNRSWLFGFAASKLTAHLSGNGTDIVTLFVGGSTVLAVGTVVACAMVYKPSAYLRLFSQGSMVAEKTTSIPASLYNSNQDVTVGGAWNLANPTGDLDGHLYALRITPRAKSPEELWRAGGRTF